MLVLLGIYGCAGVPGHAERNAHADSVAGAGNLQRGSVEAGLFKLTTYTRITRIDQPLTIYIEGDGFAWRTRTQASDDPTPIAAQGLTLAAVDPSPNVVYLARPCQYGRARACDVSYWTSKRFAEEVVVALNNAVSQYAARVPGQQINVVGYSGGGALAVLIAARRSDVASLRTVAGNLDHVEVNRLHNVSPMPESLNAIDVAREVAGIPQLHFSGEDDRVVPPVIAERFVRAVGSTCARQRVVAGEGHDGDWAGEWRRLLGLPVGCKP